MTLDTYSSRDTAEPGAARTYLSDNFEQQFTESIDGFTFVGRLAFIVTPLVTWNTARWRARTCPISL